MSHFTDKEIDTPKKPSSVSQGTQLSSTELGLLVWL